jgi:hypothetical protein
MQRSIALALSTSYTVTYTTSVVAQCVLLLQYIVSTWKNILVRPSLYCSCVTAATASGCVIIRAAVALSALTAAALAPARGELALLVLLLLRKACTSATAVALLDWLLVRRSCLCCVCAASRSHCVYACQ